MERQELRRALRKSLRAAQMGFALLAVVAFGWPGAGGRPARAQDADPLLGAWTQVALPSSYVWSLASDPARPGRLYAGSSRTDRGANFALSDDGGLTWSESTLVQVTSFVRALAVDPAGVAYAAVSERGVYASADGGATWTAGAGGSSRGMGTEVALAVDPTSPATLYAVRSGFGVYKSDDAAISWRELDLPLGPPPRCAVTTVATVAVAPGTRSRVYAGSGCGALRSDDAAATWTRPSGPPITGLAVHPTDAALLVAATGESGGVWRSADGGASWAPAAVPGRSFTVALFDPRDPRGDTVLVGSSPRYSGTGVWVSRDRGATWDALGFPDRAGEIHSLLPAGDRLLLGTDNGIWQLALPVGAPGPARPSALPRTGDVAGGQEDPGGAGSEAGE